MTGRRFESLIRTHLLLHMDGFAVSRDLLFQKPICELLCGYCFEGSLDPNGFYVSEFVQPLFVPEEGVDFTLGRRIGSRGAAGSQYWRLSDGNEAELMADVLTHITRKRPVNLEKFRTLEDFVKNAIDRETNPHSPYPPEMVAYGSILIGDAKRAHKMFDRLEKTLRDAEHRRDYHDEILERARSVRAAFERDPKEAVAILHKWREETAANLKLTKFLEPIQDSL